MDFVLDKSKRTVAKLDEFRHKQAEDKLIEKQGYSSKIEELDFEVQNLRRLQ